MGLLPAFWALLALLAASRGVLEGASRLMVSPQLRAGAKAEGRASPGAAGGGLCLPACQSFSALLGPSPVSASSDPNAHTPLTLRLSGAPPRPLCLL